MQLSFVEIPALSDAQHNFPIPRQAINTEPLSRKVLLGAASAPDDAFVSVLRDVSEGAGEDARHSEVQQEATAPLTGDEPDSVSHDLVPIARSLEGPDEWEEGKMDFLEDRGDEESTQDCQTTVMAMPCQAALPLLNAAGKASDEEAPGPVSGSCMPLKESRPAKNGLFEDPNHAPLTPRLQPAGTGSILSPEGRGRNTGNLLSHNSLSPAGIGKGEGAARGMDTSAKESIDIRKAATYANVEETGTFDIRYFKDAGAGRDWGADTPVTPIQPETGKPLTPRLLPPLTTAGAGPAGTGLILSAEGRGKGEGASSGTAYQAGSMKVLAHGHEQAGSADALQSKTDDSVMKVLGLTNGSVFYMSNSGNGDSAYESGHNPEGNDKGADIDGAVGDLAGASGGAPVFSLPKGTGIYGKDPASGSPAGLPGAEEIYQRVENAVSSIQSKAVRSVRLRLHPENMGEMNLKLTESDSVVSARITVTSPVVKDLLDADSSRLRNIFLAQGISLGKCSVELSSNSSSNDPRGFMWGWDNNGHGGRTAAAMQGRPGTGRGPEKCLMGAYNSSLTRRGGIDVFV
ncbi:MAG: flagellar hook-length control protein FliK [Deltaproteobacteria bacterium]|nr:flagellar hook-length control protein FliK [Deltaproteobacteria bacterium]